MTRLMYHFDSGEAKYEEWYRKKPKSPVRKNEMVKATAAAEASL